MLSNILGFAKSSPKHLTKADLLDLVKNHGLGQSRALRYVPATKTKALNVIQFRAYQYKGKVYCEVWTECGEIINHISGNLNLFHQYKTFDSEHATGVLIRETLAEFYPLDKTSITYKNKSL
jgi:hypothetical protein